MEEWGDSDRAETSPDSGGGVGRSQAPAPLIGVGAASLIQELVRAARRFKCEGGASISGAEAIRIRKRRTLWRLMVSVCPHDVEGDREVSDSINMPSGL